MEQSTESTRIFRRWIARTLVGSIVMGVILFGGAGTLRWLMGWVYAGSLLFVGILTAFLVDPGLLAERSNRRHQDQKVWDKALFPTYGMLHGLAIPLLSALDLRYGWEPELANWLVIGALVLFTAGWLINLWAMMTNKFFAEVVRIQSERGQEVVSRGPYRYIRHPGYLGGIAIALTTPLILGSLWGLLAGLAVAGLLILRTALEDRTLKEELAGYEGYTQSVRYRLVPGVW